MSTQKPSGLKVFAASFVTRLLYLKPRNLILGFISIAIMIGGFIHWIFQRNDLFLILLMMVGVAIGVVITLKSPLYLPQVRTSKYRHTS